MRGFSARASMIVHLSRGTETIELTLTAPPVGLYSWLRSAFPPPEVFVNGSPRPDEGALHEYHALLLYCRLAHAIGDALETRRPSGRSRAEWQKYAEAVRAEFRAAHLNDGDILILMRALNTLEESSLESLETAGNS